MSKPVRGRLYVDKDVQRALIWQLLRHWVLFVTILTAMLLALQWLNAGPSQSLGADFQATWVRNAPLFLVIAALLPVFVYDSIKLSHRFVGPIIRLRRALRQLARGEAVEPLKFRNNDFWQDVATHFNVVLDRLPQTERATAEQEQELVSCGAAPDAREI